MADGERSRERYGEAFWRAHHEAWRQSDLNQREYCEAQGLPLKAFGNWRAKVKAAPQLPGGKVLYSRGRVSDPLYSQANFTPVSLLDTIPAPPRPHSPMHVG